MLFTLFSAFRFPGRRWELIGVSFGRFFWPHGPCEGDLGVFGGSLGRHWMVLGLLAVALGRFSAVLGPFGGRKGAGEQNQRATIF